MTIERVLCMKKLLGGLVFLYASYVPSDRLFKIREHLFTRWTEQLATTRLHALAI